MRSRVLEALEQSALSVLPSWVQQRKTGTISRLASAPEFAKLPA